MKTKSFKKMAILGAITTLVSMESFATTLNCPNAALGLGNTCPVVGTSGDINIIASSSNTPITSNEFGDGITADAYRPGISNYINTAMANVNAGFAAIDAFQSGSQLGGDEVNHYQDSGHNKNLWARTYVLNESLEGKERF